MFTQSVLSGFISEPSHHSSSRLQASGHSGLPIDYEQMNPCGDRETIEHERELETMGRHSYPEIPDQQMDFRDLISDFPQEGIFCKCNTGDVEFCPLCDHPGLMEGEICICNLPVRDYHKLRLWSKRAAPAYDDNAKPLSKEYCAVIITLAEARELCLRTGLSQFLFER
jgi:hypothetical protein